MDLSVPYSESSLSLHTLRELIRDARGRLVPDYVARFLRTLDPKVVENEAGAIAEVLAGLVAQARDRLREAGIEPVPEEARTIPRIPKREREYVSNIALLLAYLSSAYSSEGRFGEALKAAEEGLGWACAAADYRQQSVLWRMVNVGYMYGDMEKQVEATVRSLEAARRSNDPLSIVAALSFRAMYLVSNWQTEQAERLVAEAFEMLEGEPGGPEASPYYGSLLNTRARVVLHRVQYAEGIRLLRQALRWAVPELYSMTRTMLLTQLGAVYLRLAHYRHAIECQHEMIRCANVIGSNMARGWGSVRLASAYLALNEYDETRATLERAADCAVTGALELKLAFLTEETRLLVETGRLDDALERCRTILKMIGEQPLPDQAVFAHRTMGSIDMRCGHYTTAEAHYRRALDIVRAAFPNRLPDHTISLARALVQQERDDEAAALLDEITGAPGLNPIGEIEILRLRANIAERRGDLRLMIDLEREVFKQERELLERQAEQSLQNARIIAETDLLEREADLERERRRRLEHELADAVVELSDRRRMVEDVQQRLRGALARAGSAADTSAIDVMREALAALHGGERMQSSSLHYLGTIDEDFLARLRSRCTGLSSKQERLCALIRAGLSSKEIGSLMGLAPEGLKAQRKRLRKKLGLEADDNLEKTLGEL